MNKNRLIIVEGPQGTGKTTLTNHLRETIPSSNLYRLSGQKDKTKTGEQYSIKMYQALINYLKNMQDIPMDMIFDRTFFTEEVYSELGYKEYSFHEEYLKLVQQLYSLNYDIYYISLYLEKVSLYEERLRRVHHQYQAFSLDSSVNQQEQYLKIANNLDNKRVHVLRLAMDNFDTAYQKVDETLKIK